MGYNYSLTWWIIAPGLDSPIPLQMSLLCQWHTLTGFCHELVDVCNSIITSLAKWTDFSWLLRGILQDASAHFMLCAYASLDEWGAYLAPPFLHMRVRAIWRLDEDQQLHINEKKAAWDAPNLWTVSLQGQGVQILHCGHIPAEYGFRPESLRTLDQFLPVPASNSLPFPYMELSLGV